MAKQFDISVILKLVDRFSPQAIKASQATRRMGQNFTALSMKAEAAARRLKKVGTAMTGIGRTMTTRLTLPLAAFGALALRTTFNFERAMNMVKAVTKASTAEAAALDEVARRMGSTTQFTATEAADAMRFMGMAGMEVNQILAATPKVLELAASAQLDMGTAADIVTSVMAGYGKTVGELNEVNDVLVNAFTRSKVDLQGLGESFKFVGPVAKAAGITFKDTAAVLGILGKAGIDAGTGGTSLRRVISGLLNITPKSDRVLAKLGITQSQLFTINKKGQKKLRPIIKILELFETKGLDASDAMKLFGLRGGPAMAALIGQGSAEIKKLRGFLDETGSAARIAEMQMKGMPGALLLVKSAWEALHISIFKSDFGVWVEGMLRGLASFMQSLSETDSATISLVASIGTGLAIIGPFLIMVGFLAQGLGALGISFAALAVSLPAIVALGAALALMASRMELAEDAFKGFWELNKPENWELSSRELGVWISQWETWRDILTEISNILTFGIFKDLGKAIEKRADKPLFREMKFWKDLVFPAGEVPVGERAGTQTPINKSEVTLRVKASPTMEVLLEDFTGPVKFFSEVDTGEAIP